MLAPMRPTPTKAIFSFFMICYSVVDEVLDVV